MTEAIFQTPPSLKTVGELFSDFYVVPEYQREYVWEANKQVQQMLTDLADNYDVDITKQKPYFLGSIVVCGEDDNLFEVIDGQQRMTTLYILLCAIRDRLAAIHSRSDTLQSCLKGTTSDDKGEDVPRFRLELQYKDSIDVLVQIAEGESLPDEAQNMSASVKNILGAYGCASEFLTENFASDPTHDTNALVTEEKGLKRFFAYVTKQVQIIRITTKDVARALWVFETINDRGVSLDSMDLLKNLLFRESNQAAFDTLHSGWKQLIDELNKAKEKPLRFIRYFILANYDVKDGRLGESDIYSWFKDNDDQCHYKVDPIKFVEKLLEAARAYAHFVGDKNKDGKENRYLSNITKLSGSSRQHFLLLLASSHLNPTDFNEVCRQLENLIFTFIVTKQQTNKLESLFAQAASDLRNAHDRATVMAAIDKHFKPKKAELTERFNNVFMNFTDTSLQKYRVKYILAKLSQHIDEDAGNAPSATNLGYYLVPEITIEHILPQDPDPLTQQQFDKPAEIQKYIHKLGNLALLEKTPNSLAKNKSFAEKQNAYVASNFLLTKSLGGPVKLGANTRIDKAVKDIPTYNVWDSQAIDSRQKYLAKLATKIWDMSTF